MPKPNNPYRRPIDATKESAQTIGEYYGTRSTDKAINHAAGGRNIAPASRYQAIGLSNAPTATALPKPKPKRQPKTDPTHAVGSETVTAEDLFEW
ncbi:MAG TPA: hypothetical protein VMS92_24895 [Mycobacterium sp.]|nr:hypothetical protein [Mycobacterium sp.]